MVQVAISRPGETVEIGAAQPNRSRPHQHIPRPRHGALAVEPLNARNIHAGTIPHSA
jgi:hypothetical protein